MASEVLVLIKSKGGSEVTRDLGSISATAEKGAGPIGKLGGALGDVAKIASGFVIGQGLLKLPGMIGGATSAAAELEQSIGGVESIFGESADTVLAWGRTAHESAGLSQDAFNKLAVPLGAMLKNAGRDMGDVTDKTLELTQRAADMAATFGGPVEDAVTAIAAMMRGETDPIEKYGVSIKAADVNLRALADTGKKSEKDLTPLELQNARLALLMEQTASAAGQFGREADTAAGKAERLKAKQENLSAQLGAQLLPLQVKWTQLQVAATDILTNKLVPAVAKVSDYLTNKLSPAFAAAADFVQQRLVPGMRDFASWLGEKVAPVVDGAAGLVRDVLLPALVDAADVVGGFAQRVGEFGWDKLQEFASWINETLMPAVSAVADKAVAFGQMGAEFTYDKLQEFAAWATETGGPAVTTLRDAVAGLSMGDLAAGWGVVLEKARPAIDAIRPFAEQLLPTLKSFIAPLKSSFAELGSSFAQVGKVFAEHKETFEILGKIIGAVIVAAIIALLVQVRILITVFGTTLVVAVKAVALALELVAPVLDAVLSAFEGVASFTKATLIPAMQAVADFVIVTLAPTISSIVGTVAGVVTDLVGKAADFLSAGKDLGSNLMEGIKTGLSSVTGFAGDVADAVLSAVKNVLNTYVIDPINRALEFKIPIPGAPDIHVNPPDIPRLAAGAIVSRPTLAVVGDAGPGNPEVVAPLSKLRQFGLVGGAGAGVTINIYVQGAVIGRSMAEVADELARELGRAVR